MQPTFSRPLSPPAGTLLNEVFSTRLKSEARLWSLAIVPRPSHAAPVLFVWQPPQHALHTQAQLDRHSAFSGSNPSTPGSPQSSQFHASVEPTHPIEGETSTGGVGGAASLIAIECDSVHHDRLHFNILDVLLPDMAGNLFVVLFLLYPIDEIRA